MCVRLTSILFQEFGRACQLISVTRKWRYCGLVYKFFLINNIESVELKCSFVRCQKYHMIKWRRRASHLGRFTLWHNGRRATQLGKFTLWHNGHLTNPGLMHASGVADILQSKINSKLLKNEGFGRFSNHRSMYALRRYRRRKRLKARQMCVDDDEHAISNKPLL